MLVSRKIRMAKITKDRILQIQLIILLGMSLQMILVESLYLYPYQLRTFVKFSTFGTWLLSAVVFTSSLLCLGNDQRSIVIVSFGHGCIAYSSLVTAQIVAMLNDSGGTQGYIRTVSILVTLLTIGMFWLMTTKQWLPARPKQLLDISVGISSADVETGPNPPHVANEIMETRDRHSNRSDMLAEKETGNTLCVNETETAAVCSVDNNHSSELERRDQGKDAEPVDGETHISVQENTGVGGSDKETGPNGIHENDSCQGLDQDKAAEDKIPVECQQVHEIAKRGAEVRNQQHAQEPLADIPRNDPDDIISPKLEQANDPSSKGAGTPKFEKGKCSSTHVEAQLSFKDGTAEDSVNKKGCKPQRSSSEEDLATTLQEYERI